VNDVSKIQYTIVYFEIYNDEKSFELLLLLFVFELKDCARSFVVMSAPVS